MAYRILMVEDQKKMQGIVRDYFIAKGSSLICASDGEKALELLSDQKFDLILLDIMMPGMDGIDLCVQLRKSLYCPIIFISCLDDEETIVRAMRMGGDDYLTKPFRYPILQAHMEAALRRMQLGSSRIADNLKIGSHTLSTREHVLIKTNEEIYLSPTEFELLIYFINNENTVLRFEEIYQYIWKKPSYGDLRTVYSHIRNLRMMLEDDPSIPHFISTVPRIGYRFNSSKV